MRKKHNNRIKADLRAHGARKRLILNVMQEETERENKLTAVCKKCAGHFDESEGKWSRRGKRFLCNICLATQKRQKKHNRIKNIIGVLILLLVGLLIYAKGYSYEIRNVTHEEAGALRGFISPKSRNITAWIRPGRMSMTAVFEIEESEFVEWNRSKGWKLGEIENVEVQNISANADPNGQETISAGLMYRHEQSPDALRISAYDRTKGVGYFAQF